MTETRWYRVIITTTTDITVEAASESEAETQVLSSFEPAEYDYRDVEVWRLSRGEESGQ